VPDAQQIDQPTERGDATLVGGARTLALVQHPDQAVLVNRAGFQRRGIEALAHQRRGRASRHD
jgi:hypothetical protein